MSIIFETSIGEFTVDLFCDERPKCCINFLKLCKMKYYNYCLFHSIQERLVAQTGDPTGSGNGGFSMWQQLTGEKYFQNELKPKIKHHKAGLLSMVNNGSNMHGSQFCITLSNNLDYLDGKHTVFGEITDGIEIIKKFNEVFVDKNSVPLQDVRIYHTIVLDDPFEDPESLVFPEASPEPREDQLNSGRVGAEEDLTATNGATEEELAELEQMKEARANAQILAVIGDIPDEDIKPPDNVLFVCSLNPLTCSEDLELIFSRFGEILSCEVIRDHKTGSSLQYAFIEFREKSSCEKAYFDMEKVLIDDRRIHVDFSQSVSKQWQMYKGQQKADNIGKTTKIDDKYNKKREKDDKYSKKQEKDSSKDTRKNVDKRGDYHSNDKRKRSKERKEKSKERKEKSKERDSYRRRDISKEKIKRRSKDRSSYERRDRSKVAGSSHRRKY